MPIFHYMPVNHHYHELYPIHGELTIFHREKYRRFQGLEAARHSGDSGCTSGCTSGDTGGRLPTVCLPW